MQRMLDQIEKTLIKSFNPIKLKVLDVSESHRGHSGFQDGGESHFEVEIIASSFLGMRRVDQHRAIHKALGPDVMKKIHALSIQAFTIEEFNTNPVILSSPDCSNK